MILNYLILRLFGHHLTGVRPLSYRSSNIKLYCVLVELIIKLYFLVELIIKLYCVLVELIIKLYCVLVELIIKFYCVLVELIIKLYCVLVELIIKLYCVLVELIISHKTRLFDFQRLKGLRAELFGPSDHHLVKVPLWLATWGLNM